VRSPLVPASRSVVPSALRQGGPLKDEGPRGRVARVASAGSPSAIAIRAPPHTIGQSGTLVCARSLSSGKASRCCGLIYRLAGAEMRQAPIADC